MPERAHPYTPQIGYGWADVSKVTQRDRGPDAGSALERDFCLPQTPFYVDLPNGTYDVSLVVGDYIAKSGMSVRAEGFLSLGGISAPAGHYARDTFRIKVTDGRLRIEFFASVTRENQVREPRIGPRGDANRRPESPRKWRRPVTARGSFIRLPSCNEIVRYVTFYRAL